MQKFQEGRESKYVSHDAAKMKGKSSTMDEKCVITRVSTQSSSPSLVLCLDERKPLSGHQNRVAVEYGPAHELMVDDVVM